MIEDGRTKETKEVRTEDVQANNSYRRGSSIGYPEKSRLGKYMAMHLWYIY